MTTPRRPCLLARHYEQYELPMLERVALTSFWRKVQEMELKCHGNRILSIIKVSYLSQLSD